MPNGGSQPHPSIASLPPHEDSYMLDGERPEGWLKTNAGPVGQVSKANLVAMKPKVGFAHRREYEEGPKIAQLTGAMAVQAKYMKTFNKTWRCFVYPASDLLPRADPESMLVLLNMVFPEEENETAVELPAAGEVLKLHFPASLWKDPVAHADTETWTGKVIETPQTAGEKFNVSAIVYKPSDSKVRVLDAENGEEIVCESGSHQESQMENEGNEVFYGDKGNRFATWLSEVLLGQHNHKKPRQIELIANSSQEEKQRFGKTVNTICQGSTPTQRRAVDHALSIQLTIVRGPPGTGKTFVIKDLLDCLYTAGECVLLVAPSRSATTSLANAVESLWTAKKYAKQHSRWTRRAADEEHTGHLGGKLDDPVAPKPAARVWNVHPPTSTPRPHLAGTQAPSTDIMEYNGNFQGDSPSVRGVFGTLTFSQGHADGNTHRCPDR